MAFSSCFCLSPIPLKIDRSGQAIRSRRIAGKHQKFFFSVKGSSTELFGEQLAREGSELHSGWSFLKGSRIIIIHPKLTNVIVNQKASGLTCSQLAISAFTLGTVAVLPFYTLMVVAPKAELTRKSMESSMPYVLLGLLYAFLLYLSWTPDTLRLLFPNKYWLPELPGIAKMFSREMTLASAWIHMLAVDLFAARQVFRDGLQNEVETRHSVSLCMLACPIGIVTHVITKALAKSAGSAGH